MHPLRRLALGSRCCWCCCCCCGDSCYSNNNSSSGVMTRTRPAATKIEMLALTRGHLAVGLLPLSPFPLLSLPPSGLSFPQPSPKWGVSIPRTPTVHQGWVNVSHVISGVSGPTFTKFILFNAEGTVVDNAVYRLSISLFVPVILTIWRVLYCLLLQNLKS